MKPDYMIVCGMSLATMCALNIWTKGYGKMFCVLIGIVVGYVLSSTVGILNLSAISPASGLVLFRLPRLDHMGFSFDPLLLAPFPFPPFAPTPLAVGDPPIP